MIIILTRCGLILAATMTMISPRTNQFFRRKDSMLPSLDGDDDWMDDDDDDGAAADDDGD